MKKRSPRLTDDELVQIAMARFEAYRTRGRAASFEELSEAFDRRDPSVLVRAITRAFRKGLVSVTPVRSPQPTEDAELAGQLRRHFPIDTAIVVRADESASEDLPRLLGVALARHLANSSVFRHGEAIAMSPGRSCFWAAKAMADQPPLAARDVAIYSLSGSWGARRAPYVNQLMDADTNAQNLAQAFSERVRLIPMLSAMIAPDVVRPKSLSKTWMAKGDVRVDHIVVGAGVVMKYKQWIFDDRDDSAMDRELIEPIRQAFDELVDLCERFAIVKDGKLIHCHVGDLGNHLIFVPWPLQDAITPDAERRMRELIDEINAKMLTPRRRFWFTGRAKDFAEKDIRDVEGEARRNGPRIMLIAGGREKGSVVHALLHQGYPISVLCTTTDVAEFLLLNRKAAAQASAPPATTRTRARG